MRPGRHARSPSKDRRGVRESKTDGRSKDRAAEPPAPASDSDGKPLRMSVCPVASHTRTPVGTGIMVFASRRQYRECASRRPCRRRAQPARAARSKARSRCDYRWQRSLSLRSQPAPPLFVGAVRETGRNADAGSGFASVRAAFRQRNKRFGVIPCRRAIADTFTPGRRASAIIACFSSSLQRRRVSATTAYRWAKLSPDIGTGIVPVVTTVTNKTCILARPQGGLHRRITKFEGILSQEAMWAIRSWLDTKVTK